MGRLRAQHCAREVITCACEVIKVLRAHVKLSREHIKSFHFFSPCSLSQAP